MFNTIEQRDRHEATHDKPMPHCCSKCSKKFKRVSNKRMHEKRCGESSSRRSRHSVGDDDERDADEFHEEASTLRGVAKILRLEFATGIRNLHQRYQNAVVLAGEELKSIQRDDRSVKYYISLQCNFYKPTDPDTITNPPCVFNSETCTLLPSTSITTQMEINYHNILRQVTFIHRCSYFTLRMLLKIHNFDHFADINTFLFCFCFFFC